MTTREELRAKVLASIDIIRVEAERGECGETEIIDSVDTILRYIDEYEMRFQPQQPDDVPAWGTK